MNLFNINTGVIALFLLIASWSYITQESTLIEKNPMNLPWVPIDVGKSKVYVSQTRDASMFTERTRRMGNLRGFKPSNYKDFTNGVVDSSITGICVYPYKKCEIHDAVYDGSASGDICILDGNGDTFATIDAGVSDTVVCGV